MVANALPYTSRKVVGRESVGRSGGFELRSRCSRRKSWSKRMGEPLRLARRSNRVGNRVQEANLLHFSTVGPVRVDFEGAYHMR